MGFSCEECARRKIKCDKVTPICSSCQKRKIECRYQDSAPHQRPGKRPYSQDLHDQLAYYEQLLSHHGLLPTPPYPHSISITATPQPSSDTPIPAPQGQHPPTTGELVADGTKSRYVESFLWKSLGPDAYKHLADESSLLDDTNLNNGSNHLNSDLAFSSIDPLSASLLQSPKRSLLHLHPTPIEAQLLWRTYIENVEPLCKLLHVPSTSELVETAFGAPASATPAEECLLFSIYHLAIFSMTEQLCSQTFGHSRQSLLTTYDYACRQSLVNTNWLRTTDLLVMQALLLYLLPSRYTCNPNTFWVLCGAAVRIAQRMGLHTDDTSLALSPFDRQIRRRLSFQLLMLDGMASRMVGCAFSAFYGLWEINPPLSLNDDQIWPAMNSDPVEQIGATDMMFVLVRKDIFKSLSNMHASINGGNGSGSGSSVGYPGNVPAMDEYVRATENALEQKYVRYCDPINPLHFLTMCIVRAAVNHMRLRARLPTVSGQVVPDDFKQEMFSLSSKILQADSAACAHTGLARFHWFTGSFFLYGSWDSLLYILNSLAHGDLKSSADVDAAWAQLSQTFSDRREELIQSLQPFHRAIGMLTVKAWNATREADHKHPQFIQELLARELVKMPETTSLIDPRLEEVMPTPSLSTAAPETKITAAQTLPALPDFDFNFENMDWLFWDNMIKDHHAQHA